MQVNPVVFREVWVEHDSDEPVLLFRKDLNGGHFALGTSRGIDQQNAPTQFDDKEPAIRSQIHPHRTIESLGDGCGLEAKGSGLSTVQKTNQGEESEQQTGRGRESHGSGISVRNAERSPSYQKPVRTDSDYTPAGPLRIGCPRQLRDPQLPNQGRVTLNVLGIRLRELLFEIAEAVAIPVSLRRVGKTGINVVHETPAIGDWRMHERGIGMGKINRFPGAIHKDGISREDEMRDRLIKLRALPESRQSRGSFRASHGIGQFWKIHCHAARIHIDAAAKAQGDEHRKGENAFFVT